MGSGAAAVGRTGGLIVFYESTRARIAGQGGVGVAFLYRRGSRVTRVEGRGRADGVPRRNSSSTQWKIMSNKR